MSKLRADISALSFVTGEPGSFDYWNPPHTGRADTDRSMGRASAACLIHLMRHHEFPAIYHHVILAWREKGGPRGEFLHGFVSELASAILHGQPNHPHLVRAAHIRFKTDDHQASLLQLPFATQSDNGVTEAGKINLGGDNAQRLETGKFYGAALCQLIIQTGWTRAFQAVKPFPVTPEAADVVLGMDQAIAEVIMSSASDCTMFQAAMLQFFDEEKWGVAPTEAESEAAFPA